MTGTEALARDLRVVEGGNQAIETRRIPLFQKDDGGPGAAWNAGRGEGRTGDVARSLPGHRYLGRGVGASRVGRPCASSATIREVPDGDGQPLASVHRALTGGARTVGR